jgi:lipopolysaccharide/colanic/teichoic acid biosynthesis glycosyltransferase
VGGQGQQLRERDITGQDARSKRLTMHGLLAVGDEIAVAAALLVAYLVRAWLPVDASAPVSEERHLVLGVVAVPLMLGLFARAGLYFHHRIAGRIEELRLIARSTAAGFLIMAAVGFSVRYYVARSWLVLSFALVLTFVALERTLMRRIVVSQRARGRFLRSAVVIGANAETWALANHLHDRPALGYRVLGLIGPHRALEDAAPHDVAPGQHTGNGEHGSAIDDAPGAGDGVGRTRLLGDLAHAAAVATMVGAEDAIIATTGLDVATTNRLARELTDAGMHVELSSSLVDITTQRLFVRPLGRYPMMHVEPVRRHGWRAAAKRTFDLVLSTTAIAVLSPVLGFTALAVKLDSRGPVLFRQTRVGRNGRPFTVVKFRSMVDNAEDLLIDLRERNERDQVLFKMKDDPRVTRVGRFIRATSIDELPQLFNVLRGDMSLVGPRPALASEVAHWPDGFSQRLRVRPGITGMWQVSSRASASFDDYARLDLYYVDNWSLVTDLAIVAKTIPVVLGRKGAH